MIFNSTYKLGKILTPLTQEEILNTPTYFAISSHDILIHKGCPEHLKRLILELDWTDERPDFCQVRIQDYRKREGFTLGSAWHVDVNTIFANGRHHLAKDLYEFRSMTASFGDVRETEFVRDPVEIDTKQVNPFNHPEFAAHVNSLGVEVKECAPNQLATYTGRDIHRASPKFRLGGVRLMIVTVECDEEIEKEAGYILPALRR